MHTSNYFRIGKLLARVGRVYRAALDAAVADLGLNRSQALLLLGIAHQDGRTHSEIAERLELSPPAATKIIKYMEQQGYVQRRPDPDDERVSRVFLCERGRTVAGHIQSHFVAIDRRMYAGVSEEQLAGLAALLEKMLGNLSQP